MQCSSSPVSTYKPTVPFPYSIPACLQTRRLKRRTFWRTLVTFSTQGKSLTCSPLTKRTRYAAKCDRLTSQLVCWIRVHDLTLLKIGLPWGSCEVYICLQTTREVKADRRHASGSLQLLCGESTRASPRGTGHEPHW